MKQFYKKSLYFHVYPHLKHDTMDTFFGKIVLLFTSSMNIKLVTLMRKLLLQLP